MTRLKTDATGNLKNAFHISRLTILVCLLCLPLLAQAQSTVLKGGKKTSLGYAFDGSAIKDTTITYVIRQKLDLCGKVMHIPAGTKLCFDGGMLCNGVIMPQDGPVHIQNPKDAKIFLHLYFRNEEYEGYQKRSCEGICKDSWFSADDDDDMLNMACAFDGILLTREEYNLRQHNAFSEGSYPQRYRLLAKSFSIKSIRSSRSTIHTDGQISVIRQSFYGRNEDLGLSLDNISVTADGYTYTKSAYFKESVPDRCFFGGALNNFGHTFSLNIQNCSFNGVYQLMQWNCYNDGLNIDIEDSEFVCGSMGLEIYNGDDFRKLTMRASDSLFKSYESDVFSLVSVDADVKFSRCEVDGMELYHKGQVSFDKCNVQKSLEHSGKLIQGAVSINDCTLQQRDFACESLIFTIKGMKKVRIDGCTLMLENTVLKANSANINPILLNIQKCPDIEISNCHLETDADDLVLGGMRRKMTVLWGDGSEKQISRKAISKGRLRPYIL